MAAAAPFAREAKAAQLLEDADAIVARVGHKEQVHSKRKPLWAAEFACVCMRA